MSRISHDELLAARRVFQHVESIVGPYYGHKTLDEIKNYTSENRWMMFPEYHVDSLREGTDLPIPNVFISFGDKIQDNGAGLVNGWIGVTYHNVEAMLGLGDILRKSKKSSMLLSLLTNLGAPWRIEIQHKTKTDSPNSVPKYSTYRHIDSATVTQDWIIQSTEDSNQHLLRRGDIYPEEGNPVLWDVSIFVVSMGTIEASFDADVKKTFDLFFKILSLR